MLLKEIINKFDKSNIKAGDGNNSGKYPLYTCSPVVNKYLNDYLCDNEALIISTGGNFAIHYVDGKFNYSTDCYVFNTNSYNLKYLYYYIKNKKDEINKMFRGAGLKHLNKNEFLSIEVKEVSNNEQAKIVKILDLVENLIAMKKEEIANCDELINSQFIEMFGNININSNNYEECKLSNHLKVIGGYAFKSKDFKDKGIPVLRIGNINTGFFRPKDLMFWNECSNLEKYAVYPGDVVMSLTGTVGKDDYGNICIMGNEYSKYYLNQRNAKLILKDTINSFYITYAIRIPEIKKRLTGISRGVRQANIANRDIENLKLPIPPIELQNKFATIVEQIDKQKLKCEESLKKLEELQSSLMQEYFG